MEVKIIGKCNKCGSDLKDAKEVFLESYWRNNVEVKCSKCILKEDLQQSSHMADAKQIRVA